MGRASVSALAVAAQLIAAITAGCGDAATPRSCADSLAGVWTEHGSDRRYHVLDHGARVEMFPMWDTTVPAAGSKRYATVALTPRVLDFARSPGDTAALSGALTFQVTYDDTTCPVRWPATASGCAGGQLELVVQEGPLPGSQRCAPRDRDTTSTAGSRPRSTTATLTREGL